MRRLLLLLLLAAVAVGACGGSATATPGALARTADPVAAPATPSPTGPPASPLSASWVSPRAGAKVTTYTVDLSAQPDAQLRKSDVKEVVFRATWSDRTKVACSAAKPAAAGTWSCKANLLKLGIPPGRVTFSFDITDNSGRVAKAPAGTRRVTYAVAPPKPTKAGMQFVKSQGITWVYRVTWSEPAGYASRFRLYFVRGCPNFPKSPTGTPCLTEHTPLRQGVLEPVATAAGTARSLTFSLESTGACVMMNDLFCDTIGAVVLGADNSSGESVLSIVKSAKVVPDWRYYHP